MAVMTLLSLPKDILSLVKASLTSLGSHVAFSQTCRSLRALYDLEKDFKIILRKCGVGKPAIALLDPSGKQRTVPTWTQLACGVAKHSQSCKRFKACRDIGETDPSLQWATRMTVLTPASPTKLKNAVRPSFAGQTFNTASFGGKVSRHDFYCRDPDRPDEYDEYDPEGFSSHLAAACSFITTRPINSLQLVDYDLERLENVDGITCNDFAVWLQPTIRDIELNHYRSFAGWVMLSSKAIAEARQDSATDAERIAENDFVAALLTDR